MAYMHIPNLYKDQTILLFKECYALEKIHGTSAHIRWGCVANVVDYYSGGVAPDRFRALFDHAALTKQFRTMMADNNKTVMVCGEAYGGSCQKMAYLYGPDLKFVVFDVKVGVTWLNVPKAEAFAKELGLEFVPYNKIPAYLYYIDMQHKLPSKQALRNGIEKLSVREGIVLRPLEEMTLNNGDRVIAKNKGDAFKETKTPRKVDDPAKLKILEEADAIAEEWVTEERLCHVLDANTLQRCVENAGTVIKLMQADISREAKGEIVESKAAMKAIGRATVALLKGVLKGEEQ